jgi:hypothetical protein
MPLRVALNAAYAVLAEGLDESQRQQLDEQVYGWGELNQQANRLLRVGVDDDGGGES